MVHNPRELHHNGQCRNESDSLAVESTCLNPVILEMEGQPYSTHRNVWWTGTFSLRTSWRRTVADLRTSRYRFGGTDRGIPLPEMQLPAQPTRPATNARRRIEMSLVGTR